MTVTKCGSESFAAGFETRSSSFRVDGSITFDRLGPRMCYDMILMPHGPHGCDDVQPAPATLCQFQTICQWIEKESTFFLSTDHIKLEVIQSKLMISLQKKDPVRTILKVNLWYHMNITTRNVD